MPLSTRHITRTLFRLLAVIALAMTASPAVASSTPSADQGVASLNTLRSRVGLLPVKHDRAQSAGCQRHAAYYALTKHVGHDEVPGDPGYTASGDEAARTSNLVYQETDFVGADDWTEAVYHRIAMLHPRLADSGYWAENGIACLGVLGEMRGPTVKQLTAYPYPVDGQQGVAISFPCNERPNPCAAVKGASAKQPTGTLLSVQFDVPQDSVDATTVTSATVTADGAAEPIGAVVQDARDEIAPYLRGGLAIIPRAPLEIGTWYTGHVTGVVSSSDVEDGTVETPFNVSWRFQTGPVVLSAASSTSATRCSPTRKGITKVVSKCKAKKKSVKKAPRRAKHRTKPRATRR